MKKQDMAIKITVFDSGVGISKYDLDRIGQPFEQVNYNLNGSSSGLGLYMIRKFSESLGGKLNIVSRKNIGTLCSVTIYSNNMRGKVKDLEFDINSSYLPYSNYIKRALWGSYERQIINHSDSYIKKTVLDILECTSNKEPFYEEKIYQLGLNILVAEDYAMNIQVMKSIAKKVGISVVFAKDGQEVVDMYFKDRSFDVIIMDIQMPKLNGFEATAMIREFDKNINIIASSAHLESEVHDDIIASGVSDFLQKPYTIEEFVSAIERNSYLQL